MKKIKYIKCSKCGKTFTLWAKIVEKLTSKKKYCSKCRKEYCIETKDSIDIIENCGKLSAEDISIYKFVINLATIALKFEKEAFYKENKIIGIKRKNRVLQKNGYVNIKINDKWHQEHRLIMEKELNRELTKDEFVHHINGITWDNRPENLLVVTKAEHGKLHTTKAKDEY